MTRYYNLANLLSVSRIILTLPIVLLLLPSWPELLSSWPERYFVAGWLFMLAMATDVVDGYLARRGKGSSSLGVFLDLVADKVLVLAVLALLAYLDAIPAWMASVIVAREIIVMALRWRAASRGKVIPAAAWGKGKTFVTAIGIAAVIMGESLNRGEWGQATNWGGWLGLSIIGQPVMAAATLLTVVSGALYARTALPIVFGTTRPKTPVRKGDHPRGEPVP
ncbi:MAG: CDP-diacylglycerol--glycerol-3-phosphate 3-phosphatidyltransferase [Dehalococcoidia bacterium]|nr:CDP-diacylglycerol--glycerol-3-phosphate 3-phosphatidyltransferase [Dehalococcoidia bacterium]